MNYAQDERFLMDPTNILSALFMSLIAPDLAKNYRGAFVGNFLIKLGRLPLMMAKLIELGHEEQVHEIMGEEEDEMKNLVHLN